jgi:hypothetical protein
MLRWYGHVACMKDNRWPKLVISRSPGGRGQRGRPEVQWGIEIERVIKGRNLTSDDTVTR